MADYDPLLTMSALNMAVVSLHRITSSGDRLILDREYDSIINNLRMGEINADPELTNLYQEIVRIIHKGKLRDDIRARINEADTEKKHKGIKEIITGNVFKSFSTNPLKWIGKLAMSSASEYFTQQKEAQELKQDNNEAQLRLKHDELDEYDELQRKLLGSSWSLLRQYHLPDSYRLTQKALVQFSAVMNEIDPSKRQIMMKYLERDFAMYAPYWFYRAKSANESGSNDDAGKYFDRFNEVWRPVLRKDPYRAEAMKYRIEELMCSGVTQDNAGEILKCLADMRENTELDDWANNIFAGMVYFALGMKDEAVDCVMCNVLFHYENEMSNQVLERMEMEELPPRIEPLPEKLPEPPKPKLPPMSDAEFLKLCESGDTRKVEEAIKKGANVNSKNIHGWTALILATRKGKTEVVKLLLKYGADVNAKNKYGETALMWAEDAEVAEILIKHDANIKAKDNYGKTALMKTHNAEVAEVLIKHNANVNAKDDFGYTALIDTAIGNRTEVAEVLINHGADVNAKNKDSDSALTCAAQYGLTEVVEVLLKHGADINAEGKYGKTALMWAAIKGHTEVVKLFIKHGADVNAKGIIGMTALMDAAFNSNIEVAKVLINHGADVNVKDNWGRTALMCAAEKGQIEVAELLRSYGAK